MSAGLRVSCEAHFLPPLLLLWALSSCAPSLPPIKPPENYRGPIGEAPTVTAADYWVYERADGRRTKSRPQDLLKNVSFPLWVGKWWSYETQGTRVRGQSLTERAPIRMNVECEVKSFDKIAVTAGTFEAFECKCQCTLVGGGGGVYTEDCGAWTLWYAPAAKNIVRVKTESTESSMQLAEYKVSTQPVQAKPISRPGFKAEKPEWKVGYQWRYAWKGAQGSGTFTQEIIREDMFEGVPSYVRRTGKNETFYSKDILSELATMSSGRLASKYSPPYQVFSWPLEVGKEWRNTYTIENVEKKSSQNFDFRMVVSGVEQITVPAGSFEALKIEVYRVSGGNLLLERWYSSKAKWMVKSRTYLQAGVREEELMSFKVD